MMHQLLDVSAATIDWSRAQFALTAIYHWLFVPLTLGLAVVMGIVETCYYRTRKEFWKEAAKFWQRLFGVNFAMGVATGIILEFEFGTNRRYLRSASCHRRNPCIFHGEYICCSDVLWLEEGLSGIPLSFYLANRYRRNSICMVDISGQCMDAISYRSDF